MKVARSFAYAILFFCFVVKLTIPLSAASDPSNIEARLAALENRFVNMQSEYERQIADLNARIEKLQGQPSSSREDSEEDELSALRRAAVAETQSADINASEKSGDDERRFIAGDLSKQAENPEISIVGDFVYRLQSIDGNRNNSDAMLRNLGIHYETYLDPYTKFKGAVPVKEDISNIGEAYITRYGLTPNLNLTLGKFRQQFGIVHRWHMAGLDQSEFPLAMRRVLGDGGLCQNGVSFDWNLGSTGKTTQELTMQLTESTNQRLFAGNTRGMPSLLLHFRSFRDIDVNTYQELGLTALAGVNDQWSISQAGVVSTIDETRPVYGFGLDFTHLWEPADNMRYRNFMWRTEFYGAKKEILVPDSGDRGSIMAWGGYTNFQWKLDRQLESGVRIDYFEPDSKKYAAVPGLALAPLAVVADSPSEWQLCPYITWHQTPWVKYRLEFNYKSGNNMGPDERRLMLQCIWSAGPHKHDRY
ncbi:MAG: hypothetical protein CVV42_07025 [Candidatus Riflebacteria bacterium HGW-Riflebacteria-2]|jgi:hypothetical protein|nr:MAG: hypothetical protein CVV42_07025 [Candidatus Riflebacteria bacterium HGW-Riflebacteria-2]